MFDPAKNAIAEEIAVFAVPLDTPPAAVVIETSGAAPPPPVVETMIVLAVLLIPIPAPA